MPVTEIEIDLIRGGTSKGVFIALDRLPTQPAARDAFALALMGSPDPMQLDGLGGTHSSTSKLMAITGGEQARRLGHDVPPDIDVAYVFGQVGIREPVVDWRGDCGNLTAGIALHAILHGLVPARDGSTRVRMLNLNSRSMASCDVPTPDGAPAVDGTFSMPGVPGTAARIEVALHSPAGGAGHPVLPTGRPIESIELDGASVSATILDVMNPVVIVPATALGIRGTELPDALNRDARFLAQVEALRAEAARRCGLAAPGEDVRMISPAVPRVLFAARAEDHVLVDGSAVAGADHDVVVRTSSMGLVHHALTGSGLMAAAAAARLPGAVLSGLLGPRSDPSAATRLAHPKGVVEVRADVTPGPVPRVDSVTLSRTARRLLSGTAYVRIPDGTMQG